MGLPGEPILLAPLGEDEEGVRVHGSEDEPVRITQALQGMHLAMKQEGARAMRAVYEPKPDLVIDGPFLVWFQRLWLAKPHFVGYITEEDWKNPGEIKGAWLPFKTY